MLLSDFCAFFFNGNPQGNCIDIDIYVEKLFEISLYHNTGC